MKNVNDTNFDAAVLASETPVLVDFWADWCGPCKQIAPLLEQISSEFEGRVEVVKANIEEATAAPAKFGIRNLPTLVLFKSGRPVATLTGTRPKAALASWLDGVLAAEPAAA
jgi:thioredoxin 1